MWKVPTNMYMHVINRDPYLVLTVPYFLVFYPALLQLLSSSTNPPTSSLIGLAVA